MLGYLETCNLVVVNRRCLHVFVGYRIILGLIVRVAIKDSNIVA